MTQDRYLKSILAWWAVAIWLLLIVLPVILTVQTPHDLWLKLPFIPMSLVWIGCLFLLQDQAAYGHFMMFLLALLLVAGWI